MSRPDFVTNEDLLRWSENIDNDPRIPVGLAQTAIIREVMYAGLWLAEKLEELGCPEFLIPRIQFSAGRASFGRDTWEVCQEMLDLYASNKLEIEEDLKENQN